VETNNSQDVPAKQTPPLHASTQQTFAPQKSIPEWEMYIDSNSYAIQYPPAWNLKIGKGNDTEMLRIESPDGKNVLIIQGLASFSSKPLQSMCDGLITTLEVECWSKQPIRWAANPPAAYTTLSKRTTTAR